MPNLSSGIVVSWIKRGIWSIGREKGLTQVANECNFVPVKQLKHTDMDNRNEETQFADEQTTIIEEGVNEVQEPKKTSKWKKTAAMAGVGAAGIAGGIGLSAIVSGDDAEKTSDVAERHTVKPVGDVKVAEVNDDMSFSEAFASARKQVGAGGVFEWRGKQYGTYYKTEWDSMSQAEKDRYAANVFGTSSSKSSTTPVQERLQHDTPQEDLADNSQSSISGEEAKEELVGIQTVTDESGNPITVVAAKINGYNSVFVHADVDGYVDVAAMDANADGVLVDNEVVTIAKGAMPVSALMNGLNESQPVAEVPFPECAVPTNMEEVVMENPLEGMDSLGF